MISPHGKKILDAFEDVSKRPSICMDFRQIRSVAMTKAWEIMTTEHISFKESITKAWQWVRDKCAEVR